MTFYNFQIHGPCENYIKNLVFSVDQTCTEICNSLLDNMKPEISKIYNTQTKYNKYLPKNKQKVWIHKVTMIML